MNICSDNHEVIVYEGRGCPMCLIKEERDDLAVKVEKLKEKIDRHVCEKDSN